MKTKNLFVIVVSILLVLGLITFPSFGQADTVGSIFTSTSDNITDFSGFQGTAGDSASHKFSFTADISVGVVDTVDTFFVVFPTGFYVSSGVDTIAGWNSSVNISDPDTFGIAKYNDTIVKIYPTGTAGYRDTLFGATNTTLTFSLKGIKCDTTLFGVTVGGAKIVKSGRFYVDSIKVYADTTMSARNGTTFNGYETGAGIIKAKLLSAVPVFLQSGKPDSFHVGFLRPHVNAQRDTAGNAIDSVYVTLLDQYNNVVRDTMCAANLKVTRFYPGKDSNGAVNPSSGRWINVSTQIQSDSITGLEMKGDTAKVYGYGYTKADTIRLMASYDPSFGNLGYGYGTVAADRIASSAVRGYATNWLIIQPDTAYAWTQATTFSTVGRGDKAYLSVYVKDRFDNACINDSVRFRRNLTAGQWLSISDSSTILTSDTVYTLGITQTGTNKGYAKIVYKSLASVNQTDGITITVIDQDSLKVGGYFKRAGLQQIFTFTVTAGSVQRITLTPTTTLLGATDTSRYVSGATLTSGAKKARAGASVVFLARLWDQFGNQKSVDATNIGNIVMSSMYQITAGNTKYTSTDSTTQTIWVGGSSAYIIADPAATSSDVAKYTFATNDTVPSSLGIGYKVWGRYKKSTVVTDTALTDTTSFTTTGGSPARISGWYSASSKVAIDTVKVSSATTNSNSNTIYAKLLDDKGNKADTTYADADTLIFSVSGATKGTAGFGTSSRVLTTSVTPHAYTGTGWSSDSTTASAIVWADSAKGTLTVSLTKKSGTLTGSGMTIRKQPLTLVSSMIAKISASNSPAASSSATEENLTSGFYSGSSRDILVWFKDAFDNYIYPDTNTGVSGPVVPKYNTPGGDGMWAAGYDSLRLVMAKIDSAINMSTVTRTVWGTDPPTILSDTGHVRFTITALPTKQGSDTLIVRWNNRLKDTLRVTTTLPSQLHHFVISVLTSSLYPSDTTNGKSVTIASNHEIKVEPRDASENPIYNFAFDTLIVQLMPASGETLPSDTVKGTTAPTASQKSWVYWSASSAPTLKDSIDGALKSVAGSLTNEYAKYYVKTTKSLKNATVRITAYDTVGGASAVGNLVTSTSTAKLRWYPMGIDTLEISTSGTIAEQTQFDLTITPKDMYKNIIEDTTFQVDISASKSGIEGITEPVLVNGATSIKVKANNQGTVDLYANVSRNITDESYRQVDQELSGKASLTVSAATVNAPTSLTAADFPGDAGGYVLLTFTASSNHPGMTGDTDNNLGIDYYQVYRNASGSTLSGATYWATIPATPLVDASYTTIRAVVSTNGDQTNAYYWVAAVKGNLPPGQTVSNLSKVAAELGESVVAGIQVEEAVCDAKEDVAVLTSDGRLISATTDKNKARAINNVAAASLSGADLNADKIVDILDIGIVLDILDNTSEFDAVMDLNSDGIVDVLDIGRILDVFNQTVDKSSPVNTINSGINVNSSIKLDNLMNDNGEEFTLSVLAEQITGMTGYQFNLVYDPKLYEFVSVSEGELLTSNSGTSLFIHNDANGNLVVAGLLYDASSDIVASGSGVLATVKFKWIGDEATAITINSIKIMDKNQNLNTVADLILEKPVALPTEFALSQNYPNPFNPTTTIKYNLPKTVDVNMTIYNILGQKVKTLVNDTQKAGYKKVVWNGTNDMGSKVASGIYIYRLKAGDFVSQQKMVFLK